MKTLRLEVECSMVDVFSVQGSSFSGCIWSIDWSVRTRKNIAPVRADSDGKISSASSDSAKAARSYFSVTDVKAVVHC